MAPRLLGVFGSVGGVLLGLAGNARAADAVPVRVRVEAPVGCPSADEFIVRLGAELAVRSAGADEPAHSLLVEVRRDASGFVGSLGSSSTAGVAARDTRAASCEQVFSALALTAALALEGRPAPLPPALSSSPAPSAPPPHTALAAIELASQSRTPVPRPSQRVYGWAAGARLLAGSLPLLLGPTLELSNSATRGPGLSVALRLGLLLPVDAASSSVELLLPEVGVRLGVLGLPLFSELTYGVGISTDLGLALGGGKNIANPTTAALPFAHSGVFLALSAGLGAGWRLQLDGGVGLVWLRPQFVATDPERVVEQAGPVGATAGVGFGRPF